MLWMLYPLDFYSPHEFRLPHVASLSDYFAPSAYDGSTVTHGLVFGTYVTLPLLRPKALPVTALAALLMFSTAARGGLYLRIHTHATAASDGTRWTDTSGDRSF
jgi:hypothetical protein